MIYQSKISRLVERRTLKDKRNRSHPKSCSPYVLPIIIVEVLSSVSKWKIRLCSNTTNLNKVTIKDAEPLPNFRMIFNKLGRVIIYTIMDIIIRYWQVRVQKEDIPKTAFIIVWIFKNTLWIMQCSSNISVINKSCLAWSFRQICNSIPRWYNNIFQKYGKAY